MHSPAGTFRLLTAVFFASVASRAAEFSPKYEAELRESIANERKFFEDAPGKPLGEVMPKLIWSVDRGAIPDQLRLGFDRRNEALATIKQLLGYEEWFRERLRTLLPPGSVERDTRYGRIKIVKDTPANKGDARGEQYVIFMTLERLATVEALRVLADYLWDDRYTYEPGDDYGSPMLAEDAERASFVIRRSLKPTDRPPFDRFKWREWLKEKKDAAKSK